MKTLSQLKVVLFSLSLIVSTTAWSKEKTPPAGKRLNQIVEKHYPAIAKVLNRIMVDPKEKENYLNRFKAEDRSYIEEQVLGTLVKGKALFLARKDHILLKSNFDDIKIELVDYISLQYRVNGTLFKIDPKKSIIENSNMLFEAISKGKAQKKTVFERILFIEDAHAVFFVPFIWAGMAIAGSTFMTDLVSGMYNDINNNLSNMHGEIEALTETFKSRADRCEGDLARLKTSPREEITGNSSVVMVARLVEGLNADLNDTFLDGDGKDEIDYDDLGCDAYDGERDGIHTGTIVGIWGAIVDARGSIARPLCNQQERLNDCLSEVNEVINDNGITINDIPRHNPIGEYDGLVEEYQILSGQGTTSR